MNKPKLNQPDVETTVTFNNEELLKQVQKEILIEINGKKIPLSKLPCNKCEWRYSIHCPKCEWNKNGKVKVY